MAGMGGMGGMAGNDCWNITFEAQGTGNRIMIQATPNELVGTLCQRYESKAGIPPADHPNIKYISNSKTLDQTISVAQAGLTNNAQILVVGVKGLVGAQ